MDKLNIQIPRLNCTISKIMVIAPECGKIMLSKPAMKNIIPTAIAAYPNKRGIISDLSKTNPIDTMSIGAGP
jgi:hypothetical protein